MREEEDAMESGKAKLYYQYYRKPMANWLLMPAISAMPGSVKRTALTQYGLRILRNTKLEVEWSVKAAMLSEFMERLRDSGYSHRFRQEILQSVLTGWESIVEEHLTVVLGPIWTNFGLHKMSNVFLQNGFYA